jgi:mannitol-1-phosphate 5-dehydrogenase
VRTAVQFGAGNIGRGFLAQLFCESGLEVVFVDVTPELLDALNTRGEYTIRVVGPRAEDVAVKGVRGVDGRDGEAAAREVAACEVACTAVGAGALKHVAPNLAAGLRRRHREGGGPLNVLICENLHGANTVLRGLVAERLPKGEREAVLAKTGFVQAVVSRMVPLQTAADNGGDPLAIRVEAYKRLPIDGTVVVGNLPDISGVEPVENFLAYVERKLYTHNCAHATLGYLGYRKGIEFGYDALEDPEVVGVLRRVLAEASDALIRKHGFAAEVQQAHVEDLLERFANRALGDTCFRLARDPVRKLAPDDRLVGAARMCELQGVEPAALAKVIAAALRFDAPEDPAAVQLQARIAESGIAAALRDVCGIGADERLGRRVLAAYAGA